MANNSKIEICESYKDFLPPLWVHESDTRLIEGIPEKYTNGLHSVTLTNTAGLSHNRRQQKTISRKRKVSVIECRGLYHQKWQGKRLAKRFRCLTASKQKRWASQVEFSPTH